MRDPHTARRCGSHKPADYRDLCLRGGVAAWLAAAGAACQIARSVCPAAAAPVALFVIGGTLAGLPVRGMLGGAIADRVLQAARPPCRGVRLPAAGAAADAGAEQGNRDLRRSAHGRDLSAAGAALWPRGQSAAALAVTTALSFVTISALLAIL